MYKLIHIVACLFVSAIALELFEILYEIFMEARYDQKLILTWLHSDALLCMGGDITSLAF